MAIADDMITDPKNLGHNLYCYYCCMTCINGKEWILVIMQYLNLNNNNYDDDDKRPTWGSSIGWPHGNPNEVGFSLVKFSSIIGARSLQSFIVM